MATESKGKGTEDKLRELIRGTFEELLSERDKKGARESETKEQRWLRDVIREELGSMFEEFVKGATAGDKPGKGGSGGDAEEEAGEEPSILQAVFGGGRRPRG